MLLGGGKLYLFGGEFSSVHQTTFHHYRDFWVFDVSSTKWERIEAGEGKGAKLKGGGKSGGGDNRPSARSGHRMAMWKHYIFLFGGFYDPGIRSV